VPRTERAESVDAPLESEPSPPRLGKLVFRFALLVLIVGGAFAAARWTPLSEYFEPERLAALLDQLRGYRWAPAVLILLWLVLPPLGIPVSPLVFSGGAVFGLVAHVLGPKRLERAEGLVARHGFWTLVRIRFIPIPFVFVNYGAAFAGFRFSRFMLASAIGLAPSVFIYTYFADALVRAAEGERGWVFVNLGLALGLVFLLTFFPHLRRLWKRRHSAAEATDGP
jgi:uncharacterized membrane protein YdjX (TVP38/TMEM64 family)